jgi:hypothetical protein
MEIKPEDVAEVSVVGKLHGDDVKMVKTHGGLHVMVGKKEKDSKKPDALAAASHRALASHQLEKMFGKDFQPIMAKSEGEQIESVMDFEVTKEMSKDHLEIHSIAKNDKVDFTISRFGVILAKYECEVNQKGLSLNSYERNKKADSTLIKHKEDITKSVKDALINYSAKTGIELSK